MNPSGPASSRRRASTVDAHHHFWHYDSQRDNWIDPASVLATDFLPSDLAPVLADRDIVRTIVVQAAQDKRETAWLLGLAETHEWIAGVIGWLDLRAPGILAELDCWSRKPRLLGLRHIVQAEPDPHFLRDAKFLRGVEAALHSGLSYDILVHGQQTPEVPAFVERLPMGRLILDHGGKPAIARDGWQPWADAITAIARYPNVWCKLSGLVTEANHATWTPAQIERYLCQLHDAFGPERLIFGSDWPVCLLAASYSQVYDLVAEFVARNCSQYHDAIFGKNAVEAYNLRL